MIRLLYHSSSVSGTCVPLETRLQWTTLAYHATSQLNPSLGLQPRLRINSVLFGALTELPFEVLEAERLGFDSTSGLSSAFQGMSFVEKQAINLGRVPAEVLLDIFSYLDLPELLSLSRTSWNLRTLATDPILHRKRILVVAPSRVEHSLFAQGVAGPIRPTVPDLVQRNVMRGLQIERRWRMGAYIYSAQSVKQYETSVRLYHDHVVRILTRHLRARALQPIPESLSSNLHNHVPVETRSHQVSRSLLPVIVRLKWSMARDRISRSVRVRPPAKGLVIDEKNFKRWWEGSGHVFMRENERVRLAICPGIKNLIGFYENLSQQ